MTQNAKTFGEMSKAEKGELLLAHHEGRVVQAFGKIPNKWIDCDEPSWFAHCAYRIRPEPNITAAKSVTWAVVYSNLLVEQYSSSVGCNPAKITTTFTLEDGKIVSGVVDVGE